MTQDSSSDRWIYPDSDPDVFPIASKALWIHYFVGISHLAEYRENRPATVREILIKLLNPHSSMVMEVKRDLEYISSTTSPPKVNQFF